MRFATAFQEGLRTEPEFRAVWLEDCGEARVNAWEQEIDVKSGLALTSVFLQKIGAQPASEDGFGGGMDPRRATNAADLRLLKLRDRRFMSKIEEALKELYPLAFLSPDPGNLR